MRKSNYLVVRVRCFNSDCEKLFEARFDKEKEIIDGKIDTKRICPYCRKENRIFVEKAEADTIYRKAVKGLEVKNG